MTTTTTSRTTSTSRTLQENEQENRSRYTVFSSLIGLSALVVLLQGVWAGIFLAHDGQRDASSGWIDVHARGADLALLLAVVATGWAIWKLRSRKDLWLGGIVFVVLLVLESYLGGLIRDAGKDTLTVVHVPMALGLMGLAVWLPLRARRGRA
jgi:hypothetical protein